MMSLLFSGMIGALECSVSLLGGECNASRILDALADSANVTAVAFWIVFALCLSYQAAKSERSDEAALRNLRRSARGKG